jgi:cytochrome c biogenesis factor
MALAAVRLARRSPAADRMLAWTGAGRHAPARARALEIGVVLALSCALSALALLALRPLAHLLLEPGDGRAPEAVLALPGSVLLAAAGWLALAALAATAAMVVAASSQSTVEVLRGED